MKTFFEARKELKEDDIVAYGSIGSRHSGENTKDIVAYGSISDRAGVANTAVNEAFNPKITAASLTKGYTAENLFKYNYESMDFDNHVDTKANETLHNRTQKALRHHPAINDEILFRNQGKGYGRDKDGKEITDRRNSEQYAQGSAVADYVGNYHVPINGYLLEHKDHPKVGTYNHAVRKTMDHATASMIKPLDQVTTDKRNAAKGDFTVFSGVVGETTGRELMKARKGRKIHFPAYTSTSTRFSVAHNFAQAKHDLDDRGLDQHHHFHVVAFHMPKGYAKGRHIGDHSDMSDESEVLLARNQQFKKELTETNYHGYVKPHRDLDGNEENTKYHFYTHVHHVVPSA